MRSKVRLPVAPGDFAKIAWGKDEHTPRRFIIRERESREVPAPGGLSRPQSCKQRNGSEDVH